MVRTKKGFISPRIIVGISLTALGTLGSALIGFGVRTGSKDLFWAGSVLLALVGTIGTIYSRWV